MHVTVKYFGSLRDYTHKDEEEIVLPQEVTVGAFRELINKNIPELKEQPYKVAFDRKLVSDDFIIAKQAEIALLPPYSGG